jgi:hypothetical protein
MRGLAVSKSQAHMPTKRASICVAQSGNSSPIGRNGCETQLQIKTS